ncbi:hypothetical protein HK102_004191 [Quaeritorhiza haematococci]|nr:hypothetical protein HK102_004191 [Quaeritorhiza haematococci]
MASENCVFKGSWAALEKKHRRAITELESCQKYKSSMRDLQALNDGQQQYIDGLKAQLDRLRDAYDACILEVNTLQKKNGEYSHQLEDNAIKFTRLEEDNEELREVYEGCSLTVKRLRMENKDLQTTRKVLDQQLAAAEKRYQNQCSDLKQLENKLLGELRGLSALNWYVDEQTGTRTVDHSAPIDLFNRVTTHFTQIRHYASYLRDQCKLWSDRVQQLLSKLSDSDTNLIQLNSRHEATQKERDDAKAMVNRLQQQVYAAEKELKRRFGDLTKVKGQNARIKKVTVEIKPLEQDLQTDKYL